MSAIEPPPYGLTPAQADHAYVLRMTDREIHDRLLALAASISRMAPRQRALLLAEAAMRFHGEDGFDEEGRRR